MNICKYCKHYFEDDFDNKLCKVVNPSTKEVKYLDVQNFKWGCNRAELKFLWALYLRMFYIH